MRPSRRFSQAIAEGDGISLLAEVTDPESAHRAEEHGAEGVVVRFALAGVREATQLPILWGAAGSPDQATSAGADACLLVVEDLGEENSQLERLVDAALDLGLDAVIEVRNEDELQLALDRVDPEIFLLSGAVPDADALEHVLGLLHDVPAGKLAVAQVPLTGREDVDELERAGVDAVIVRSEDIGDLVAPAPPSL